MLILCDLAGVGECVEEQLIQRAIMRADGLSFRTDAGQRCCDQLLSSGLASPPCQAFFGSVAELMACAATSDPM